MAEPAAILAERWRHLVSGRSAGPALLALCVGIGGAQWQTALAPVAVSLTAAGGGAVVLVLAIRWRWSWLRLVGGVGLAFALGFSFATWRAEARLADALPLEWERRDIVLTGVVAELPRETGGGRRFAFAVEQVHTPGARVPARVLLSWHAGRHEDQWLDDRRLRPGERWTFTVRLKRPHGLSNPGGFDYEAWLLERDLRATGYVRAEPPPRRGEDSASPLYWAERARSALRERLQNIFRVAALDGATDSETASHRAALGGIVIALAIGDQGGITREHWRVFAATGTTHLMSISGLHVTMLAALVGALFMALWRRWPCGMDYAPAQRVAVWTGWLAALAYTLLAGAGIPAVRTLLMLSVAALTHTLDRRVGATRILTLALVVVLLVDPWAVLAVGFWLSFVAVALLIWFAEAGAQADWRAPPKSRGERLRDAARRWTWAQWVVTLGSVPLVLTLFNAFSVASPLANALAIPLVGGLVAPLSIAAALLPLPALAESAAAALGLLMAPLEWLAAQPWALWRQADAPTWTTALAVAGIGGHFLLAGRFRYWALLAVLPLLLWPAPRPRTGDAWLDLLDVGHGLAVVVRTADHNLLFDAGPRYHPDASAGERAVLPALRAFGVNRLDGLVVSHQDNDHAGGVPAVVAELSPGWLAAGLPDDHPLWAVATRAMRCEAGARWVWDGVRFEFLSPPADYFSGDERRGNRMSCVLRIDSAAGRTALLTADAEAAEEAAMLAGGRLTPVDVLQVPHQGSKSSSSPAFVAAVRPKIAWFPVGYRNSYGHPHPEVLRRYEAAGSRILRSDRDGALRVELGETATVGVRRSERRRYWDGR